MLNQEQITRFANAVRSSADDLRAMGFKVAVHNDYEQGGKRFTFWLLTIPWQGDVLALKGEAENDADALDQIRARWAEKTDHLHHAPMCNANHYHGKRAPTGVCNCGALAMQQGLLTPEGRLARKTSA